MSAALKKVLASPLKDVEWGLKFFPSPTGNGNCSLLPGIDVPIPATAQSVQDAIKTASPENMTPTTLAIKEAVAYFSTLNDGRSHNILLATDGQPNCDYTARNDAEALVNAQAAIAAAAAAGIKVYVIGIGPSVGNLDNLANAGGTGQSFPATSPEQLSAALATITGELGSCVFTLSVLPQEPDYVVVQFNGDRNLRARHDTSHTEGWDYTSPSHAEIQLYGSWCDNLTNETYASVEVLMGCPTRPVL